MGIDPEKYRKMSVEGKWIGIALEIVRDNPGLTRSEIIAEASVYMPLHIANCGKKQSKIGLARMAVSHRNFSKSVVEDNGRFFAKPAYRKPGHSFKIVEHAKKHGTVCVSDFPSVVNFGSLACQQVKRGALKRVSKGVYAINNDEPNTV